MHSQDGKLFSATSSTGGYNSGYTSYSANPTPVHFVTPLETVLFMGKRVPAPNHREQLLELRYGADWKTVLGVDNFVATRRSPDDYPSRPPEVQAGNRDSWGGGYGAYGDSGVAASSGEDRWGEGYY